MPDGGVQELQARVLHKKQSPVDESEIHQILRFARETHTSLGDILGRTYDLHDLDGHLVGTARQRAMGIQQFNMLARALKDVMHNESVEAERRAEKSKHKRGRK